MSSPPGAVRPSTGASEVVSLAERMGFLQALRVAFACAVLGAAVLAPNLIGAELGDLLPLTAAYLLLSASVEGLRRLGRGRGLALIGGMLLVDGAFLAWVMYSTGGIQSPLRFLVYLHLIAVTLLASYRTGLKITLWHTLLFFVVYYAQSAGILEVKERVAGALPGTGSSFQRLAIFNVLAFWLIALGTTAFSALNERELRRRKSDVESLAKLAARLEGEAATPEEIAQLLLEEIASSFGFKRGVVLTGGQPDMALIGYMGPGEPASALPGIDPVVQEAWEGRVPLLRKQLDADENRRLSLLLPFARNVVVIPLYGETGPIGVLAVEYPESSGRIERRVVSMLAQFASHAALALRNAWLLEQVQLMADTDALTGVANRRLFQEILDRELSRAARSGETVTLMMLDVDHFKKFNDKFGHQAGDEVLKDVARVLILSCRNFDTPARYGGEEFAVILPACSSRESLAVADRIRSALSEVKAPARITASAGVASFPVHATDVEGLIKSADEALYESKRAGRNRVTRSRRRGPAKRPLPARRDS